MPIIHLTQTLKKQLGNEFIEQHFDQGQPPETHSTVLTAWTGNMITYQRKRYVIFTNENTLLTILAPLGPKKTLMTRFLDGLNAELLAVGVPHDTIITQIAGHRRLIFQQGSNRQILGYMNDMFWSLEAHLNNILFQTGQVDLWSGQRFLNDEFLHLGRFEGVTREYVRGRFRIR